MDLWDFRSNIIHLIGVNGVNGLKCHKINLIFLFWLGLGVFGIKT